MQKIEIFCKIIEGKLAGRIISIINIANNHSCCENSRSCREHELVSEAVRALYAKQMWYYELRCKVAKVACVFQNETSAMKQAREQCTDGWVVRDSVDGLYIDVFSTSELAPFQRLVSEYPEYRSCFFTSSDSSVDVFTSDDLIFVWSLVQEVEALPESNQNQTKRKKKSR